MVGVAQHQDGPNLWPQGCGDAAADDLGPALAGAAAGVGQEQTHQLHTNVGLACRRFGLVGDKQQA